MEESGLDFLLHTVRSIEEAFTIPDRNMAEIIFVDIQLAMKHNTILARRLNMAEFAFANKYTRRSLPRVFSGSKNQFDYNRTSFVH